MEFTLHYEGSLKSNRGANEKHQIRKVFHSQLRELWKQEPLSHMTDLLEEDPEEGKSSIIRTVGNFKFAPVVSETLKLVAEIRITMLRPEPPGSIVNQGGDIDNRLKTLLDSLKVPDPNAIEGIGEPDTGEAPFFCLLEDDSLITHLAVSTDRLLMQNSNTSDVLMLLHITTKHTVGTWDNIGL